MMARGVFSIKEGVLVQSSNILGVLKLCGVGKEEEADDSEKKGQNC